MSISKEEIFTFLDAHRMAVVSTNSAKGAPESALIYAVPTRDLEILFYTLETTRKCANLRRDGHVALVIGWPPEGERTVHQNTVQYEGIAVEQTGEARETAKTLYLEGLPQNAGMSTWPGLTFFRVRPSWVRFSSYEKPWRVEEIAFEQPRKKGLFR